MQRTSRGFLVLVAIVAAGCLVTGCGSAVQSAISSVTSRAAASTDATDTITPTPTAPPTTPTAPPTTPTAPPTTAAPPSTATTTVTATATPSTPTPTASPTASGDKNRLWLWVLIGVLVLAGLITLITLITRSGRRRSATAAGWRSRVIDAYAKGSALHDAMSVAESQGDLASNDARARWYDIQRRADDLTQTLYGLREAASDPGDQGRIADVLASLQAVRSAMDAERAPGGASMQLADVVRSRLAGFESSLRALRAGDQEYS